jgi:hypothetical protein
MLKPYIINAHRRGVGGGGVTKRGKNERWHQFKKLKKFGHKNAIIHRNSPPPGPPKGPSAWSFNYITSNGKRKTLN